MMSELKLTDRTWGKFTIGDLFHIKIGKSIDGNKVDRVNGQFAYITRKEQNNGLDGFIDYAQDFLNMDYPVITVGNETAEPFVQYYPFFTGTKVNILKPKKAVSSYALSFIATSLKQHKSKYSYSFTINSTRLKKQVIMLPAKSDGQPDWQFMEDFIKQKEQKQKADLLEYYSTKALDLMLLSGSLKDVRWGYFEVQELFTFESKPSKGLNHLEKCSSGGTNYVGATNRNNGVLDYVSNNPKLTYRGNAIAFIRNGEGAMGYSVYKAEDFIATQDVSVGYNANLNKYNGLFITAVADKIRGKYNFGYKRNQHRLNKEKLCLPILSDGNPDWQFMEDFMRQIERDKIQTVLKYYNPLNYNEIMRGGVKQNLNKVKWSVFYISDYFEFIRGNQNNMAKCETGNIPLISAKKVDNGYKDFIKSNGKKLFPKHILTLNNDGDGGVGLAYYQPVESALDTHVTALVPKLDLSKYALLFVSRCISHQREKFSHGYSLNNQRLHSQKIMLPENMDGQPSWVYMSNYMQQIELQQIIHYLSYQAR